MNLELDQSCVYCGGDCSESPPLHEEDCPFNTGVFPILEEDIGEICIHCGERTPGVKCSKCLVDLQVGEHVMYTTDDDGIEQPVCIGCMWDIQQND